MDPAHLAEEQKLFLAYLIANGPTIETVRHYLRFLEKRQVIEDKDWSVELRNESEDMLQLMADSKGMTLETFQKIRVRELKELALKGLEKEFYPEEVEENPYAKLRQKYTNLQRRMVQERASVKDTLQQQQEKLTNLDLSRLKKDDGK